MSNQEKILRDTVYNGKVKKMYFMSGGQKVVKMILEERGVSTEGKMVNG